MIPLTPNIERVTNRARAPHVTAAERNVRMTERVFPHRSPDPPRQGDTPARPAKWPTVVFLSIEWIRAVMEDEFKLVLWAPDNHPSMPTGEGQLPFQERANVRRPSSIAYGSLFELDPAYGYELR